MLEHSTAAAMVADLKRSRNRKLVTDRLVHEPAGGGGGSGNSTHTRSVVLKPSQVNMQPAFKDETLADLF